MFLFQSEKSTGSQLKYNILPNQESVLASLAGISVTPGYTELGQIITPPEVTTLCPMGAVFIAEEATYDSATNKTNVKNVRAMYFRKSVFCAGSDKPTDAQVQYLFDYLTGISSGSYNRAEVEALAVQFQSYGYKPTLAAPAAAATLPVEETIAVSPAAAAVAAPTGTTSGYANVRDRIKAEYPCPSEKAIGFYIERDVWELLVRNILKGKNTLVFGPTGTGKTELIQYVCQAMGIKLNIQDMGTVQDAQSALLGVHRLDDKGHSSFDYAPFVYHVQEPGVILLDELNRSPLAANNILFPCLDSRRYLPVDIAGGHDARNITVNKDTVFFATANLGSEYSGTQQIDRALMDRFFPVELEYPKENVETRILMMRTGIAEKFAKSIVKVAGNIRQQFREQELGNTVSVRHTLETADLVADGFDLTTGLTKVIMPLFDDENGASERSKVKSIIGSL